MVGRHVALKKKAIDNLRKAESEAVERLAADNSPSARAEFREIHDTLKVMRSAFHEEENLIVRILKLIGLRPG